MNPWTILDSVFVRKKSKPCFSKSTRINPRAEIFGNVFIGHDSTIGHSRIIAEGDSIITIGKDSTIRDRIEIMAKGSDIESKETKIKDIYIGSKVFISSEVCINGPTIISDCTFIGHKTRITNAIIGSNCLIEDNVFIKNVVIPPDSVIPGKSIIDSKEKLNQIISGNNQVNYCEFTNKEQAI